MKVLTEFDSKKVSLYSFQASYHLKVKSINPEKMHLLFFWRSTWQCNLCNITFPLGMYFNV